MAITINIKLLFQYNSYIPVNVITTDSSCWSLAISIHGYPYITSFSVTLSFLSLCRSLSCFLCLSTQVVEADAHTEPRSVEGSAQKKAVFLCKCSHMHAPGGMLGLIILNSVVWTSSTCEVKHDLIEQETVRSGSPGDDLTRYSYSHGYNQCGGMKRHTCLCMIIVVCHDSTTSCYSPQLHVDTRTSSFGYFCQMTQSAGIPVSSCCWLKDVTSRDNFFYSVMIFVVHCVTALQCQVTILLMNHHAAQQPVLGPPTGDTVNVMQWLQWIQMLRYIWCNQGLKIQVWKNQIESNKMDKLTTTTYCFFESDYDIFYNKWVRKVEEHGNHYLQGSLNRKCFKPSSSPVWVGSFWDILIPAQSRYHCQKFLCLSCSPVLINAEWQC